MSTAEMEKPEWLVHPRFALFNNSRAHNRPPFWSVHWQFSFEGHWACSYPTSLLVNKTLRFLKYGKITEKQHTFSTRPRPLTWKLSGKTTARSLTSSQNAAAARTCVCVCVGGFNLSLWESHPSASKPERMYWDEIQLVNENLSFVLFNNLCLSENGLKHVTE